MSLESDLIFVFVWLYLISLYLAVSVLFFFVKFISTISIYHASYFLLPSMVLLNSVGFGFLSRCCSRRL